MQTFIIDHDIPKSMKLLDYRRLGKQRVEAIQIARLCLKLDDNHWKHHPTVKMWKGYESYLIKIYLVECLREWFKRGYKNNKCLDYYIDLEKLVRNRDIVKPPWITDEFVKSHQSNLIRKKPEFYKPKFPNVPDNLPYIWGE